MLAVVPAVIVAEIVAVAGGLNTPLELPAEWLMEWTPLPVASFLLLHLLPFTQLGVILGTLAIYLLLGGAAAAASVVVPRWRSLAAGVLLAVALRAIFSIPLSVPLGVFLLFYMLALIILANSRPSVAGRREFLVRTGMIVGGAAVLLGVSSLEPIVHAVTRRRLFPFRPPAGIPIAGITPLVTPVERFYVMDKVLQYPVVGSGWRLTVGGNVTRSHKLSIDDLLSMPTGHRYVTMECVDNPVGGPLISTALFSGVRVTEVLHRVGAQGDEVLFTSLDGYAESIPVRVLTETGAFIATGMNGETLPREHGYPARLVVPGLYGFKSVKWLTGMSVTSSGRADVWAIHGWDQMPVIHTTARIDIARRTGAQILAAGIAYAGNRGIRAVEVRVNGGPWIPATVGSHLSRQSWVQWIASVHHPGEAILEVRAIDMTGRAQDGTPHNSYPDGATGWYARRV